MFSREVNDAAAEFIPVELWFGLCNSFSDHSEWCPWSQLMYNCRMKTLGYQMMARHQYIMLVLGPYNCSIPVWLCRLLSVCFEFCTLMEKNTTWNFIEFGCVMLPQILTKLFHPFGKNAFSFGQGAKSLKLLMDEVVKYVRIWMNSHRVDNFSSGYLSTRWTKHPSVLSSDHDQKRWQR